MHRPVLLSAALASALTSAPAAAQPAPADWLVVDNGKTCGASRGDIMVGTPDRAQFGFIVSNATVGSAAREVVVDGKPLPLPFVQANSSAFAKLDGAALETLMAGREVRLTWAGRPVAVPLAGLPGAVEQLKACSAKLQQTAAQPPQDPDAPLRLRLACSGLHSILVSKQANIDVHETGNVANSATGTSTSYESQRVPRDLQVEILDGRARIRLPAAMQPTFAKAREPDGWITWSELKVDDDKITGRFQYGVLSQFRVRIDRRTGQIEMNDFAGRCERLPDAPEARKF